MTPAQKRARTLYALGRNSFVASSLCLVAVLGLVIAKVDGKPLALAVSLALSLGGLSWWTKGRFIFLTGAVRIEELASSEARGPVVRPVGVGFMILGAATAFLGAVLLAFGVLS